VSGNPKNVSVIDTTTNALIKTLKGFEEPVGIAITPDGKTAYVTNSGAGTVSMIDTATNEVSQTTITGRENAPGDRNHPRWQNRLCLRSGRQRRIGDRTRHQHGDQDDPGPRST
jgi:YVTN family beta-propeller protein